MDRNALARAIYRTSHLTGEFELRSGAISHEYFDKYLFEAEPALLRAVGERLAPLVPEGSEALAGLETGGIPLAVMVSQLTGLPTRFVRKAAKEYGTRNLAEGGEIAGLELCVVEDVVTSGGQVASSVADLRRRGAVVTTAVCVIDRLAGGREALDAEGVELRALFTMDDLAAANANDDAHDDANDGTNTERDTD